MKRGAIDASTVLRFFMGIVLRSFSRFPDIRFELTVADMLQDFYAYAK